MRKEVIWFMLAAVALTSSFVCLELLAADRRRRRLRRMRCQRALRRANRARTNRNAGVVSMVLCNDGTSVPIRLRNFSAN